MALNTSLYHLTGLTAMVKPRQLLRMSAEEIPRHLALLNIRNTPPHGHSFSPAQQLMGRCTPSTLPTYQDLLKPEAPDPLIVYTEISCCKEASKTQYDKNVNTDQPPLPLGSHVYTKPRPSRPAGGGGGTRIYGHIIRHGKPCPLLQPHPTATSGTFTA